jgi:hypothetical protein
VVICVTPPIDKPDDNAPLIGAALASAFLRTRGRLPPSIAIAVL